MLMNLILKMTAYYLTRRSRNQKDKIIKDKFLNFFDQCAKLIQVCERLSDPKIKPREIRALRKAMGEFNLGTSTILT
jgi:hypothetical protein